MFTCGTQEEKNSINDVLGVTVLVLTSVFDKSDSVGHEAFQFLYGDTSLSRSVVPVSRIAED